MPTRIVSFQYDPARGREWHLKRFRELAARHGLKPVASRMHARAVFGPDDVSTAVGELWSPKEIAELRRAGVLPLGAQRLEILCRTITIHTCVFENESGTLRATIEAAESNEFPYLGKEIWLAEELALLGGFVTFEGPAKAEIDLMAAEFPAAKARGGAGDGRTCSANDR